MLTVTSVPNFLASGRAPAELKRERIPALVVEWNRAEGLFWTLRLCERFGLQDRQWEYPTPAQWATDAEGRISYSNHPPSEDQSVAGRAGVSATVGEDDLTFEVTLYNDSESAWPDAWAWVCLIHRWAGSFQANCELPAGPEGRVWTPCASLRAPKERWLKWCPVRDKADVAARIGLHQAYMWQPHIQAMAGAVRAWRMALGRPVQQFIEMSSPDAIILGWSHWPCTDMGLYFGTLEPGQSDTVHGRIRFFEQPYTPI